MKTIKKTSTRVLKVGVATIEEGKMLFAPDEPKFGSVENYKRRGIATQLSDGSFEFEARSKKKSQSIKIKKLAHGCCSATCDGAILLTLKVYLDEGVNIPGVMGEETIEAIPAIVEFLMRK